MLGGKASPDAGDLKGRWDRRAHFRTSCPREMRPARKREKVRRADANRIEPVKTGHDQGYWFYLHNC